MKGRMSSRAMMVSKMGAMVMMVKVRVGRRAINLPHSTECDRQEHLVSHGSRGKHQEESKNNRCRQAQQQREGQDAAAGRGRLLGGGGRATFTGLSHEERGWRPLGGDRPGKAAVSLDLANARHILKGRRSRPSSLPSNPEGLHPWEALMLDRYRKPAD